MEWKNNNNEREQRQKNRENERMISWIPEMMLRIELQEPDDFLKVAETLTRIGIESRIEKKLIQSCHILHKRGMYFCVHFKEMFLLDGRQANFSYSDLCRRNTIAKLLEEWDLIRIISPEQIGENLLSFKQIKVIPYSEKKNFILESKYSIGKMKGRYY